MIKNTIIAAAAVAASAIALQPGTAHAGSKVQFHIGVGVPYHGYHAGHYRPYYGPVHYAAPRPYAYGHYAPAPRPVYRAVSCRGARHVLRSRGFHHIRANDCRGGRYGFTASRYGKRFYVTVSARSGRIIGKIRI